MTSEPHFARTLRNGFSTGSAATAAAVAAFTGSAAPVTLRLSGGETLTVPVARVWPGGAAVIKDGGDDPDVTTGSEVQVTLTPGGTPGEADFVERLEPLTLILRGGCGIGRVTRPGLAVTPGKWAINPVPRRMLLQHLAAAGCRGTYLAEIAIPRGVELAAKTLNPTLGIVGGISVLGTSGMVYPYSHAAYAATVALQIRAVAANGGRVAAVVTGTRSEAAIRRETGLPAAAVVRIGDFIKVACDAARTAKLETLLVGCMAGKLFKYACGEENTHAHQVKMALSRLREFGVDLPEAQLRRCDSMGELAAQLPAAEFRRVLTLLRPAAERQLRRWLGNTAVEIRLYDAAGERIL